MKSSNPILNSKTLTKSRHSDQAMTLGGTISKTFIALILLIGTAGYSFYLTATGTLNSKVFIGCLIFAFIIGLVTSFSPRLAPITTPIYAAVEGILIGNISAVYEATYGMIVLQAVLLTIAIIAGTLICYATGIVKVTQRFRSIVFGLTLGVFIFYLLTMVLHLFHVPVPFIHQSGPLGLVVSLAILIIASLNLFLDFDLITTSVSQGAPKQFEWYCAFGLLVTIIWIYIEALRFISKLRN
ncbi:Bax inhibitor-1/YccA family protein [Bacillus sp. EAC]|uniref:Bax inhibitor-1/YccA family protein n=1 Tax=Bacillus sp. EAC TaxID=1978338 RepID=UPI000B43EFDD|nr:Bax inhibitor-1/YccA family protein [Bacillus sp. EAC]